MIRINCVQGTSEWAAARLGIPTASQFDRIITPKTMKLSGQAEGYACELLAEQALGESMDDATSGLMLRGSIQESRAVKYYEFQTDTATTEVGFLMRDDRRAGASPDRLVGENGLLEIKVPNAANHIGYLLDDQGIGYRAQVQGQLWISEREWCDTLSYNPVMPYALVRQYRDEEFITALARYVDQFHSMMDDMKEKLSKKGLFPDYERPALRIA